jgi:hypothetical protein
LILSVEKFPVDPEFEMAGQKFKVLRSTFKGHVAFGTLGIRTMNAERTLNCEHGTCVASEPAGRELRESILMRH